MSRDPRDQAPGDRPEHPAAPAGGDAGAPAEPGTEPPTHDTTGPDADHDATGPATTDVAHADAIDDATDDATPDAPGADTAADDPHDAEPAEPAAPAEPAEPVAPRTDATGEAPATPATTDPAEAHPAAAAPSATPHDDDPVEPAAVPGDPVTSSDEPAGHDETPGAPDGATGAGERPAPADRTDQPHDAPATDTTPGDTTPEPATRPTAARPDEPSSTTIPEPEPVTGATAAVGRHGTPTQPEPRGLRGLGRAMRPRASRSQVMVGVLCALLGFALVVQVSQTQEDQLSSLRQSDLVRLLDDVTQRSGELEDQVSSLEATRDELQSGSGRERAALELAEQQAETLGILSGRLPAAGPGVEIEVVEGAEPLEAFGLFNVLEELRNAGAEAMEVNGVRLVASSYFEDTSDGVVVDGQVISSPYRWTAIGDPSTLETALEIPGGAMASLRADGARTTVTQQDRAEVTATVEPREPRYATPVPADE